MWIHFGLTLVYWLASLQSLPAEVFDAAKVDGCGSWQQFRLITWPMLIPSAIVILMLNIIHAFHVFDLVLTLTGGGPFISTTTVDLYIYRTVFDVPYPRIGFGSAAGMLFGWMVFVITGVLAWVAHLSRKRLNAVSSGGR